jgi:hypothetical protein
MARRVSRIEVNLFPFLSVLCSIIGVLMLFILGILGSRAIGAGAAASPGGVSHPSGGAAQESALDSDDIANLERDLETLQGRLDKQRAELAAAQNTRRQLQALLAFKRDERQLAAGAGLLYGVDLGAAERVELAVRDGMQVFKQPRFIEVSRDGYLVHPDNRRFPISDLPREDSELPANHQPTSAFEQLLAEIDAARQREYLLFLIRPDGADAFRRVKTYVLRKYPHPEAAGVLSRIDLGWEPFSEQWLLVPAQTSR